MAYNAATSNSNINTSLGVLKEFYSGSKLWDEIWENNPALTLLNKEMDTAGSYFDFDVKYAGSQGYAVNFANALANQTPELYGNFHVPVSQMIGTATIQNNLLRAAKSKGPGAFEGILEGALRSGVKNVTNEFARQMFGGGTNTLGQISSASASSGSMTIVLTSSLAYQFFEVGMTLDVTTSDGSAPVQTTPPTNDTAVVTAVDAAAGNLVINTGSFTTFTAGSYLIRDGNYVSTGFSGNISMQQGATVTPVTVAGLGLWCPSAAARAAGVLSTPFCNVTRSADGTRLGGISVNATGMSIQNGLIQASRSLNMFGHPGPYVAWINPNSLAVLQESLQGQRLYDSKLDGDGPVSFDAIEILGMGRIKVCMDRNVPAFTAFVARPDAYRMVSMGDPFALLENEAGGGGYIWSLQDQDAFQIRFGGYPQLIVDDPTGICQVTFSQ